VFRRRWSGNLHIGGKWPTVDVDVIESELWAEQGSVADPEATSTEPAEVGPSTSTWWPVDTLQL